MSFLCVGEFTPTNDQIVVADPELLHQLTRVLRVRVGQAFFLQQIGTTSTTRWEVSIETITSVQIVTKVIETTTKQHPSTGCGVCVALPNKYDKLELIVQKLTEIGVQHIYFRPAQRSLLREVSVAKQTRIATIIREAVEQSRGWVIPQVIYASTLHLEAPTKTVVYDCAVVDGTTTTAGASRAVIGPEGGFTEEERMFFAQQGCSFASLGDTILRMETAAIVAGRKTVNN